MFYITKKYFINQQINLFTTVAEAIIVFKVKGVFVELIFNTELKISSITIFSPSFLTFCYLFLYSSMPLSLNLPIYSIFLLFLKYMTMFYIYVIT